MTTSINSKLLIKAVFILFALKTRPLKSQANFFICGEYPTVYYSLKACESIITSSENKCKNGFYRVNLVCRSDYDCWNVRGNCQDGHCCSKEESNVKLGCQEDSKHAYGVYCSSDNDCDYYQEGQLTKEGKCQNNKCCMNVKTNRKCDNSLAISLELPCKESNDCNYSINGKNLKGTCENELCCTSTDMNSEKKDNSGKEIKKDNSNTIESCPDHMSSMERNCESYLDCFYWEPYSYGWTEQKSGECLKGKCCALKQTQICSKRSCQNPEDCIFYLNKSTIRKTCSQGTCCDWSPPNPCEAHEIYTGVQCSADFECGGRNEEGRCRRGRCCLLRP